MRLKQIVLSSNRDDVISSSGLLTIGEILDWGMKELAGLGSTEARSSAEKLLETLLGLDRSGLYLQSDRYPREDRVRRYQTWIGRRKQREPFAYITGKATFWNEVLKVAPGCLIPRQETEALVEAFIENAGFKPNDAFSFLDLGSGSGAIGIALLRHFLNAKATFSDISEEALEMARVNLRRYELVERAEVVCSDLFEKFREASEISEIRRWDAIVSNPPYLSRTDLENVEPEILFEPALALEGGEDGLDLYRRMAAHARQFLVAGSPLFLEVGIQQAEPVRRILEENNCHSIQISKDAMGIDRVLLAR